MAQVVTTQMAAQAGLARKIKIDSAGTHASAYGEPADPRAQKVLATRGYAVGKIRARRIEEKDFLHHDLILAMDQSNLNDLLRQCPPDQAHKVKLFLEFGRESGKREVPDPYYGSIKGFEHVLDLCEIGARGLIAHCQNA